MTGLNAGTGGSKLLAEVREDLVKEQADRDRDAKLQAAQRERRQKARDRRMVIGAMVLSVVTLAALLGVGIPVVLPLLNQRTSEVADRVVQDARQQRADTGRRKLAEANAQLVARNLPVVADPGDTATGDELVIAAATARVLAILPDSTVARLRDDVRSGRAPRVLPSAAALAELPPEDRVVDVIPDRSTTTTPPADSADRAPAPRAPAARPGPAPAAPARPDPPTPARPGLLQPCLLGELLC